MTSIGAEEQVVLETADETLPDTTELSGGDDELHDPATYEVVDLTDLVDANDNNWFEQVDDLVATGVKYGARGSGVVQIISRNK